MRISKPLDVSETALYKQNNKESGRLPAPYFLKEVPGSQRFGLMPAQPPPDAHTLYFLLVMSPGVSGHMAEKQNTHTVSQTHYVSEKETGGVGKSPYLWQTHIVINNFIVI